MDFRPSLRPSVPLSEVRSYSLYLSTFSFSQSQDRHYEMQKKQWAAVPAFLPLAALVAVAADAAANEMTLPSLHP